jgi:cobalt/nickel transport system permease protein
MTFSITERYQSGESFLHRLDPRVKVVATLLIIVGIVVTPERAWPAYPLLWTVLAAMAALSKLGVWRLARLGGVALPFALAAITLLFTIPGKPIVIAPGITISDAGLARFISILLKSWLATQAALLLSMTTHFTDLLWAWHRLRIPPTLVTIIAFMYRYLFTLREEAESLIRGRQSRSASVPGQKSGGRIVWRAQVAGGMVGNLFLRSYERSERVYAAMLARGYDGQSGQMRTADQRPPTTKAIFQGSLPVLAIVIIEVLALVWWSR